MAYRRTTAVQTRLDLQRVAILRAATQLLAEQGYGGCSVAAVAAKAGIATGSVYQHFPSKADLVAELFQEVVALEVDAVAAASHLAGSVPERVTAVIETFAGRALKSPRLAYALLAEPVDPAVDRQRLVFREAFRDTIAATVAAGVAGGELPAQNPQLTAAALVGAVGEVLIGPLAAGVEDTDTIPALITVCLRAMGAPHASDS